MSISSRIHDTIENWQAEWKDRLRGWALRTISEGVKKFMEDDEPAAIDNVRDMSAKIQANPNISPELKAILSRMETGGAWFMIVMAVVMSVQAIIGLVTTLWQPGMKQASYTEERAARTHRLDPMSIITTWRRDPEAYAHLFDDLKDQGWSDERIEALKFLTLFIPSADEQTLWLAREVFEPEMVDRYGLDDELPNYEETDFSKVGVDPEQMRNKWRAHWEHASFMQVIEMLHRGLLTLDPAMLPPPTTKEGWAARDAEGEEALFDWYRLVEIPPFWRPRLTAMSWNVPTRVDVRRWWDMRVIDEQELYNVYHRQGYHGKDLDNYVLWTKVYVAFPDLMARWSKGWITIDDVRSELITLGMPRERVEEMIQMKIKPEEPARVESEKMLTKTEIYKGVKKEVISWDQGIDLLMDLGYGYDEADYILTINVESLAGSPETFEEFKSITQKYKLATGREEKPMSEELKAAAAEVVKLTGEVESLEQAVEKERRTLIEQEDIPQEQSKKLTALLAKLHRAQSELARVKTEYNIKLAEWRHG